MCRRTYTQVTAVHCRTGLVYDERLTKHKCEWDSHHENPDRVTRAFERCQHYGLVERCIRVQVPCFSPHATGTRIQTGSSSFLGFAHKALLRGKWPRRLNNVNITDKSVVPESRYISNHLPQGSLQVWKTWKNEKNFTYLNHTQLLSFFLSLIYLFFTHL